MAEPETVTTAELADATGRHPATIRRHCVSGIIVGAEKVGRDWFIPLTSAKLYADTYVSYQALRKGAAT